MGYGTEEEGRSFYLRQLGRDCPIHMGWEHRVAMGFGSNM